MLAVTEPLRLIRAMARPPSLSHNLGFWSALYAVSLNSVEKTVQILWQTILTEWFPPSQGYKLGFKSGIFLANNKEPDAIVIQITAVQVDSRVRPTELSERQAFQLEFKRPSKDTPQEWEDTTENQYLDDLVTTGNPSNKLYSAVAIGKKVKLYGFDGKKSVTWLDWRSYMRESSISMPRGIAQVEQMMNLVKADGWRWAWS